MTFGGIPVRKFSDLDSLVFEIKMNFAPFAVAVYPIQVGCGGFFVFCLLQIFQNQIHNPACTIFNQLHCQTIQSSMVGNFCTFVTSTVHDLYTDFFESQNPGFVTRAEFIAFSLIAKHEREGYFILSEGDLFQSGKYTPFLDYEVIDTTLLEIDIFHYIFLKKFQYGKPYYVPDKKVFLYYADPFYCDVTEETTSLRSFLTGQLHLEEKLKKEVYQILFFGSKCVGVTFETILEKIENLGVTITEVDRAQFQLLYEAFCWQCRMQSHRGHTPREMSAMNIPTDLSYEEIMMATMEESFQTTTEKVGRNSPCPCGSGK